MIARAKFEYLYGRLMAELGIDPDKPGRIEQCARWYLRFRESSDEVCEVAFTKLPEMMDAKQTTPSLPQMLEAMKIARGKMQESRTGEFAGEWCGLCRGGGTVYLVKLPTGWWPHEFVMRTSAYAFACPCAAGERHRRVMRVYHDGLLAKHAPKPTRYPRLVPSDANTPSRPIAPAVLAALARIKRGEGPREVVLREEFTSHGLPWVE